MRDPFPLKVRLLLQYAWKNKSFTWKEQDIFKNARYIDAVEFLMLNDLIQAICAICHKPVKKGDFYCTRTDIYHKVPINRNNKFLRRYEITLEGSVLAYQISSLITKKIKPS